MLFNSWQVGVFVSAILGGLCWLVLQRFRSNAPTITNNTNASVDFAKLLMQILVIGIHTEPFGFNFWLDKLFGIITRLCVPFFFVTSGYCFWRSHKSPKEFLKRIVTLYVVWSVIYLPMDIARLGKMTVPQLLTLFLWDGNNHALWYLCVTIIGFIITCVLLKFLKPKQVFILSVLFLVIGTVKSTYSTAMSQLFGINLSDYLGSRNGLFYGFPYLSLGMLIATSDKKGIVKERKGLYIGFATSIILLAVESYLLVIHFKTSSTILWLSVLPYTYYFFEIVLNTHIQLNKSLSLTIRKVSTLMYVSHSLFIPVLAMFLSDMMLFVLVVFVAGIFSLVVIKLSEIKQISFLKCLY